MSVEHILQKIKEYGCDSGHARDLSFVLALKKLDNSANHLIPGIQQPFYYRQWPRGNSGKSHQETESDKDDKLDYLFTVDVLTKVSIYQKWTLS